MNKYQLRFRTVLVVNVILLALLVFVTASWWRLRASPPHSMRVPVTIHTSSTSDSMVSPATPEPAEPPLGPVQLSPQRLQSIGVRTGEVQSKDVADRIATTGNVAVDETKLAYVQVRFSGYIQKVFADATYQHIRKGQRLFTIYSPDLVATEREYLLARQNQQQLARSADPEVARDAASLVDAASARLVQWSIPQREIERLQSTGQVQQDLEIDSPVTGYITGREAIPNKYAQPDTRLYTVADLATIWVFAQVFQSDLGRIAVGNAATLTVDTYPGRTFSGRVDFIYPDVDMATRTARVRLEFQNPHLDLVPGMFVNLSLSVPMGHHEVIPASGVLQTGTRQIVFVDQGGGNLEPREVRLGARVDDDYIVLKGLEAGERVVTSANFLVDSESQLQAALGAFAAPPPGAGGTAGTTVQQATIDFNTTPSPPRKGGNTVRIKLTGANGQPLPGAQVTATFFMAAMPAMGMAARRVVVTLDDKGGGLYEGPVQLTNGGTWQVSIVAKSGAQVVASKQLAVDATGGM
jgi:RND family efflux transporter MFP subunit